MPNGGFPINLSIEDSEGEIVLVGYGSEVRIYRKHATKKSKVEEPDLLKIDGDALEVLAGFMQYWTFHDDEGARRSLHAYKGRSRGESNLNVELNL